MPASGESAGLHLCAWRLIVANPAERMSIAPSLYAQRYHIKLSVHFRALLLRSQRSCVHSMLVEVETSPSLHLDFKEPRTMSDTVSSFSVLEKRALPYKCEGTLQIAVVVCFGCAAK